MATRASMPSGRVNKGATALPLGSARILCLGGLIATRQGWLDRVFLADWWRDWVSGSGLDSLHLGAELNYPMGCDLVYFSIGALNCFGVASVVLVAEYSRDWGAAQKPPFLKKN